VIEDDFFHDSDMGQVLLPWHKAILLLSVNNDSNSVDDFVNTRCGLGNRMVPQLEQELVALAPVHHPFSDEEARSKSLLAVCRLHQWSFHYELAKTIALLPTDPLLSKTPAT